MKEFNLEGKISVSEQKDNTINDRMIKLLRAAFSTEHLWWLPNNLILLIYIDRLSKDRRVIHRVTTSDNE